MPSNASRNHRPSGIHLKKGKNLKMARRRTEIQQLKQRLAALPPDDQAEVIRVSDDARHATQVDTREGLEQTGQQKIHALPLEPCVQPSKKFDVTAHAAIKAVLDANVLARFFITPSGFSATLLRAIETEEVELVTSDFILEEVAAVLARPRVQRYRTLTKDEIDDLIAAFRNTALVVPGLYEIDVVATDPKDNPILACALESGAEYLVTGDKKDLLPDQTLSRRPDCRVPGFSDNLLIKIGPPTGSGTYSIAKSSFNRARS